MDTKLDFKIKSVEGKYEAFGHGPMPTATRQIGEWVITPYTDWKGTLPPEAQKALMEFLREGIPFVGLLIADDIREIEYKKQLADMEAKNEIITLPKEEIVPVKNQSIKKIEQPVTKNRVQSESIRNNLAVGARIAGNIASGIATTALVIAALPFIILFDPVLVAVLPSGEWVEIYTWWDE